MQINQSNKQSIQLAIYMLVYLPIYPSKHTLITHIRIRTERQTDGRTDRQTDGRTDGQTDRYAYI